MEKLPTFSVDLIDELDKLYPEKSPSLYDEERAIWMYAGQRELVRKLKNLKDKLENEKYLDSML